MDRAGMMGIEDIPAAVVILDADGTLTPQRPSAVSSAILELLPGVAEKCAWLRAHGVLLAIASNQSAKRGRGEIARQLRWIQQQIDAIMVRWATTSNRRKPRPEMLLEICRELGVRPADVMFVGDQETDRQAAVRAGMQFVWADEFFSRGASYPAL